MRARDTVHLILLALLNMLAKAQIRVKLCLVQNFNISGGNSQQQDGVYYRISGESTAILTAVSTLHSFQLVRKCMAGRY